MKRYLVELVTTYVVSERAGNPEAAMRRAEAVANAGKDRHDTVAVRVLP